MNDEFLLTTPLARSLYQQIVDLPVIDFHNHLSVSDLTGNRQYENIAQLWIVSDPYKHRTMRICGVEEHYITGGASDKEKFMAWCSIFPKIIGNPLYYWSVMEMKNVFDIHDDINTENAEIIWQKANRKLALKEFSSRQLLNRFQVEYHAPCTNLTDDLSVFSNLPGTAPSLRGDDMLSPTIDWIRQLETCTQTQITDYQSFTAAIRIRLDAFTDVRCRFSDHALDQGFKYLVDDGNCEQRFMALLQGGKLSATELAAWTSDILRFLGNEYARRNWTMQLHIGAQRYTSSRLRGIAGAAGGFAGIGQPLNVTSLIQFLNDLEQGECGLPRTILFPLNPADNAMVAVLSGSFCEDGKAGKVSLGPAWWWSDHLGGIRAVLDSVSSYSVLATFIGMTTDSRSLLSFSRHDYFRRILCSWIGDKVNTKEFPDDFDQLYKIAKAICYDNVKNIIKTGE